MNSVEPCGTGSESAHTASAPGNAPSTCKRSLLEAHQFRNYLLHRTNRAKHAMRLSMQKGAEYASRVADHLVVVLSLSVLISSLFVQLHNDGLMLICIALTLLAVFASVVLVTLIMRIVWTLKAKGRGSVNPAIVSLDLVFLAFVASAPWFAVVYRSHYVTLEIIRACSLVTAIRMHTRYYAFEDEKQSQSSINVSNRVLIRQVFAFVCSHQRLVVAALVVTSVIAAAYSVVWSFLVGRIVNAMIAQQGLSLLFVGLVINFVVKELNNLVGSYILSLVVATSTKELQSAMFKYVCRNTSDLKYGHCMSSFSGSIARVQQMLLVAYYAFMIPTLNLLIALVTLAVWSEMGASLTVVYLTCLMYMYSWRDLIRRPFEASAGYFESLSTLQSRFENTYTLKDLISLYKVQGFANEKAAPPLEHSRKKNMWQLFSSQLAQNAYDVLAYGFLLLATIAITVAGIFDAGSVFTAIGYADACVAPSSTLGSLMRNLLGNAKAIQDLSEIFDEIHRHDKDPTKNKLPKEDSARTWSGTGLSVTEAESTYQKEDFVSIEVLPQEACIAPADTKEVILSDVCYSRAERSDAEEEAFRLNNISTMFHPGSVTGIIGSSGSGKTTMLNLIAGTLTPTRGQITLGNKQLSYMFQDSAVLHGTVAENISFGSAATFDDIVEAAKLAEIHDFVMKLPQRYETVLDSDSVELSGGQIQRICLARALCRKPSVLLLDEVTSALDPKTECEILSSIARLTRECGLVTIMVTHSKVAYRQMDELVVMDHGAIAQRGGYDELESVSGPFQDLISSNLQ